MATSEEKYQKKFHDLLTEFRTAMLVTRGANGTLHSRPMVIADVDKDSDVWFVTKRKSGKIDEVESDPVVNVSLQGSGTFLSISGRAKIVNDRQKLEEIWSEAWKVWFPDGPQDPDTMLIQIEATEGEYWDNSGIQGLKYAFRAGKAYLTGTTPDFDPDANQKVSL